MERHDEKLRAIGDAIAAKRSERGMTQAELARRLGYTGHSHLSRVENGKKTPSLEMIFEIADLLDCDVSCFFINT